MLGTINSRPEWPRSIFYYALLDMEVRGSTSPTSIMSSDGSLLLVPTCNSTIICITGVQYLYLGLLATSIPTSIHLSIIPDTNTPTDTDTSTLTETTLFYYPDTLRFWVILTQRRLHLRPFSRIRQLNQRR